MLVPNLSEHLLVAIELQKLAFLEAFQGFLKSTVFVFTMTLDDVVELQDLAEELRKEALKKKAAEITQARLF